MYCDWQQSCSDHLPDKLSRTSGSLSGLRRCFCCSSERLLADAQNQRFFGGKVSRSDQRTDATAATGGRQQQQRIETVANHSLVLVEYVHDDGRKFPIPSFTTEQTTSAAVAAALKTLRCRRRFFRATLFSIIKLLYLLHFVGSGFCVFPSFPI